jgi:hypothetical protein
MQSCAIAYEQEFKPASIVLGAVGALVDKHVSTGRRYLASAEREHRHSFLCLPKGSLLPVRAASTLNHFPRWPSLFLSACEGTQPSSIPISSRNIHTSFRVFQSLKQFRFLVLFIILP